MVIDFFHWPNQGTWCFDPVDWPDPKAMVDELENPKHSRARFTAAY